MDAMLREREESAGKRPERTTAEERVTIPGPFPPPRGADEEVDLWENLPI